MTKSIFSMVPVTGEGRGGLDSFRMGAGHQKDGYNEGWNSWPQALASVMGEELRLDSSPMAGHLNNHGPVMNRPQPSLYPLSCALLPKEANSFFIHGLKIQHAREPQMTAGAEGRTPEWWPSDTRARHLGRRLAGSRETWSRTGLGPGC